MNDYITLDGKKYKTLFRSWRQTTPKASSERVLLSGALDVTYGHASYKLWTGEIEGPVTPIDGSWGSVTDLRATLAKVVGVSLTDHYGNTYTVHQIGPPQEDPFSPKWDGASNVIYFNVHLVGQ